MATGHLRKRVGKSGVVSYQLIAETECDPITGKRERRYKTVHGTKKQAEAALRKMIDDLEQGNVTTSSAMKVQDWMTLWVETYLPNIEETTRVGYDEKIKNYIAPELGHIQLKALKPTNVQTWINGLSKRGLSPKTIRNAYNNLNAAMKKAVVLRMIPHNPCEGAELPKLVKYQANIYDAPDMKKALSVAEGTDMYIPVLLALAVGLRRGELLALRWHHIDFVAGVVHIRDNMVKGKDGKPVIKTPKSASGTRDIAVGSNVLSALSAAREAYDKAKTSPGFHDDGFVVCQENGKHFMPDSMTQKWERFMIAKGLSHVRLHDLRHSCATAMIDAGVDAVTVKDTLGHADVTTTMKFYVHSTPAMSKRAAETMDKVIFSQ